MTNSRNLLQLAQSIRDSFPEEVTWGDRIRNKDAQRIAKLLESTPPDLVRALAGLRELSREVYGSDKRAGLSRIERRLIEKLGTSAVNLGLLRCRSQRRCTTNVIVDPI